MEDEDLRLNLVAPDDQLGDGPVPQWPPPGVPLVDALFGVNVDLLARAVTAHPDTAAAIFEVDFDALTLQPATVFRSAAEAVAYAAGPAPAVPTAEASLRAGRGSRSPPSASPAARVRVLFARGRDASGVPDFSGRCGRRGCGATRQSAHRDRRP